MTEEDLLNNLKSLIEEHFGVYDLNKDTKINDFKAFSEDIDLFFEAFSKKFTVDMASYNYYHYFFEDVHLGEIIKDAFFKIVSPKKNDKKEITVNHLLEVAERQKWFKPS